MPALPARIVQRKARGDWLRRGAPVALSIVLANGPAAAQQAGSCPAVANLDVDRSVVVHDAVLDEGSASAAGAFSFRATIDAILKSGDTATTDAEAEALVTSMIRTFRRTSAANPLSGVVMPPVRTRQRQAA